MGYMAVNTLIAGRGNRIIAVQKGHLTDLDMEEALAMTKEFDMSLYTVLEAVTNGGSSRF